MLRGSTLVAFDNLVGTLDSAVLAQLATAPYWSDRELGRSRTIEVENHTVISVTGNNIALGGDLPRRCVLVSLDAKDFQPWKRTFKDPDLVHTVRESRHLYIAAALTLVRGWHVAGCPQPSNPLPPLGSFHPWATTMAGVLDLAGIEEFLGNSDTVYMEGDNEAQAWAELLHLLHDHFEHRGSWFTVQDLLKEIDYLQTIHGDEQLVLPKDLAYAVDHSEPHARVVRVGKQLGKVAGRRFDETNVRIETKKQSKTNRYRVVTNEPRHAADGS
jgi:hypothetical protein